MTPEVNNETYVFPEDAQADTRARAFPDHFIGMYADCGSHLDATSRDNQHFDPSFDDFTYGDRPDQTGIRHQPASDGSTQ